MKSINKGVKVLFKVECSLVLVLSYITVGSNSAVLVKTSLGDSIDFTDSSQMFSSAENKENMRLEQVADPASQNFKFAHGNDFQPNWRPTNDINPIQKWDLDNYNYSINYDEEGTNSLYWDSHDSHIYSRGSYVILTWAVAVIIMGVCFLIWILRRKKETGARNYTNLAVEINRSTGNELGNSNYGAEIPDDLPPRYSKVVEENQDAEITV